MPPDNSADVKFETGHVSSPPEPTIGDQLKMNANLITPRSNQD
jgi:hypothetical protein